MVCHKVWRCHLHDHNKVVKKQNTGCVGLTDIKVKKVNIDTKKNDTFLRQDMPPFAVMKLCLQDNYASQSAAALRLLRCSCGVLASSDLIEFQFRFHVKYFRP